MIVTEQIPAGTVKPVACTPGIVNDAWTGAAADELTAKNSGAAARPVTAPARATRRDHRFTRDRVRGIVPAFLTAPVEVLARTWPRGYRFGNFGVRIEFRE
jgi:hypothetical protein